MFRGIREETDNTWNARLDESADMLTHPDPEYQERVKNSLGWVFYYYLKLLLYTYKGRPGAFDDWDAATHIYIRMRRVRNSKGEVDILGVVRAGKYIENVFDTPDHYWFNIHEANGVRDEWRVRAVFDEIAYQIALENLDLSVPLPN